MKKLSFLLTLLVLASWSFTSHALTVDHLRVEARENPEGIEATEPAFSWQLHSDEYGVLQTSYQLVVATDEACNEVVWNSGSVSSDQSVFVRPAGIPLQPSTRYYWRVTVSDNKGHTATSQETAFFVTGLMDSGWSGAQWIKPSSLPVDQVGADDEEVKDYTVEAKFEIENVAAGIVFAAKDAANCYMWQFNTEGDFPRFRPHRWNGGSAACLADIDLRGKVDLRNGREYSVRIVVTQDGRHATTYLDDVLIDERDGDFYYGKVGMRADYGQYGNRDPEVAYYDDFLVTDQSGNVRFSEDFSASNKFDGGEIRDGRLYVVGSRTSTVWVFPIDAQQQLTHFAIDYDMLLVKASAAIVFAATSANTYHMWQINCLDNANPAVRHHIYINGNLTWNDSQFTQFRKEDLLGSVHHYRV